ncbi:MAG: RloB family protein [Terracidiphilus sp.]
MARKKKGRIAAEYARRGPVREPYDYVLIVCEGKKTEPNYLQGLKAAYRLSNANIKVLHPDATDPMSIVTFAEGELRREGYDRAYCVFDRNGHANYDEAVRRVADSEAGRAERLCAATSVPCFEVWLLLHFCFSAAPFTATGALSACDRVLRELRKHLPDYSKGQANAYDLLVDRLDMAITHAKRLEIQNERSGASNPATGVHRLVQYLRELKQPKS